MTPLQQLIIERIEREGPLPFADYMQMALYDPNYGYYVTGSAKMGWEGDYYTSTDVSTLFAHCMGRQLVRMWEMLKRPDPFIVVEQGAGRGHLAEEIRIWARAEMPDVYAALDYRTEDIAVGQDAITTLDEEKHRLPSVIISNELVDAFAVHIVEVRDSHLYEVYVDMHEGRLYEVLDEPSTSEVAGYLDRYKIPWASSGDGWRAEINLNALHWMQRVAARIAHKRHGFVVAIDYGEKARDLYTRFRRRGTLMCYFHHQANEHPLAYPGQQDITAHVNFSALIAEGRKQGLRLHLYTTQREWLERQGLSREVEHLRASQFAEMDSERASDRGQIARLNWLNLRQRVAALTDPAGMGNFKVLIMRR